MCNYECIPNYIYLIYITYTYTYIDIHRWNIDSFLESLAGGAGPDLHPAAARHTQGSFWAQP